jgi:protein involved in polysaccharide export with SLBB domain
MAIVLRLGDVVDFNIIKSEKTIILTTKTIVYEILVNDDGNANRLIAFLQNAMRPEVVVKKEPKLPKFYVEGEGKNGV